MEENVFYKPGEPSSVMSLNEEVDLFASCVNIYTTETDVYGDIMDEPRELEVFDEGAWAFNLATGIVATLGLAACAVAVVATGGAALAVVAFASAAVGTGVMTAGMSYADKKNQKNRSNLEYGIGLMLGAAVGALTGVGIMYAGPALTVAGEQAGFEASFLMGTNALTVSTIPDIVTAGGMTLLATDGAYALNEINTMCTGQNLAVDTVFEGNEENYEACVVALQVLNEGLLDLTTRGYQRNGSGSSSSEAEKSDEGAEISESGVNIRGAGDEGGLDTSIKNIDEFIGENKSFDDVLDDYAKVYADKINSNQAWSWDDTIPGGENLTKKQRSIIKQQAIDAGLIPDIKVTKVEGMRYGFADFESAGVVKEIQYLPENMWKMSDAEQFKWLDEQIGGTVDGYTWHHTEIPGKMQLVPTGIHNITTHNGGRTAGMWADAPR